MLPDNLEQWRIDQDPSVPGGQLGSHQAVGALDDGRLWQLERLLDQMPTEGLPLGISLGISQPGEVRRRIVPQHLPEVRIVIESMQRELQPARQRPSQRRLASAAGPGNKDMLLSPALHLVGALGSLQEGLEDLQPPVHVADRFLVGGALERPLPGPLPIGNSRCAEARLGVVLRQQFELYLGRLGKLLGKYLRNALMVLLPCALEERLIGGLLDQGMLEEVSRLRWQPLLVEELCLH